jgi:hypothetical protein
MKYIVIVLTLFISSTLFGLAQQVDPKYLLIPLQNQRDRAANEAALCGAEVAKLNERILELEKQLKEKQENK